MSTTNDDRTFGESAEVFVKDETPDLTPEKFDFATWLSGVTPVRKSVTIYGDGAVQAEMDALRHKEATLPAGTERSKVRERLVALNQQIEASAATFVIEGRTSDWVQAQVAELKEAGVPDDEAGLHVAVAQIVSPEGVTIGGMLELAKVNEPAVSAILRAAVEANTRPVNLDPRFLPDASV